MSTTAQAMFFANQKMIDKLQRAIEQFARIIKKVKKGRENIIQVCEYLQNYEEVQLKNAIKATQNLLNYEERINGAELQKVALLKNLTKSRITILKSHSKIFRYLRRSGITIDKEVKTIIETFFEKTIAQAKQLLEFLSELEKVIQRIHNLVLVLDEGTVKTFLKALETHEQLRVEFYKERDLMPKIDLIEKTMIQGHNQTIAKLQIYLKNQSIKIRTNAQIKTENTIGTIADSNAPVNKRALASAILCFQLLAICINPMGIIGRQATKAAMLALERTLKKAKNAKTDNAANDVISAGLELITN